MKKRTLIYLVMLVLLSFAVSASVSIEGVADKYNLGDIVEITGYVSEESDYTGLFRLSFICGNDSIALPAISLNLKGGELKRFPDDFAIPELRISSMMEGTCSVNGVFVSGNLSDEGSSSDFQVTKELVGSFSLGKDNLQLGEGLILGGNVYKLNGLKTEGSAEIYLNSDETGRFLIDIGAIKEGVLDYKYIVKNLPATSYNVEVFINDIYGNRQLFSEIGSFNVLNELGLEISLSNANPLPGGKLKVVGTISTASGIGFGEGKVSVKVDGEEVVVFDSDAEIEYNYDVAEDMKTGEHIIKLEVEDEFGNTGSQEASFSVMPIVKELNVDFESFDVAPGGKLVITPILLDQAGDLVGDRVSVEVYDTKNEIVFKKVATAGELVEVILKENALPGEWTLKSESSNFKKDFKFNVVRVSKIKAELDNQTLIITNIGNVDYDRPIEIKIGEEITLVKKEALKPKEHFKVYLDEEAVSGVYTVSVLSAEDPNVFEGIQVYGKPHYDLTVFYWIIIIVIVLLLIFLVKHKKKHHMKVRKRDESERKKGEEDGKNFRKKKKERKPGWTKEDAVKDFRERIKKDMEKSSINLQRQKFSKSAGYVTLEKKEEKPWRTERVRDEPWRKKEEKKEDKKENSNNKGGVNLFSMFD